MKILEFVKSLNCDLGAKAKLLIEFADICPVVNSEEQKLVVEAYKYAMTLGAETTEDNIPSPFKDYPELDTAFSFGRANGSIPGECEHIFINEVAVAA